MYIYIVLLICEQSKVTAKVLTIGKLNGRRISYLDGMLCTIPGDITTTLWIDPIIVLDTEQIVK
jgi:hypothetical protein